MPKWLSSTLIVIGFLALVAIALLPHAIEVHVTIDVDDRDNSYIVNGGDSLHSAPEELAGGGG